MGQTLTYHGLSTFTVETPDLELLVDPWLTEPAWVDTDPESFDTVDYVFVSHGAHDHMADAPPVARAANATVITEPAVAYELTQQALPEDQVVTLVQGNRFVDGNLEVTALHARHVSFFEGETGPRTGIPLSFLVETPDLSWYYLGDTALFGDLRLYGDLYEPDVAIVPVGHAPGARAPLPPEEAALAVEWLGVQSAIPVHYVPGDAHPVEFATAVGDRPGLTIHVCDLEPGESTTLPVESE